MGRSARQDEPGAFQHVTNRGRNRQATFLDDGDREAFLADLQATSEMGLVDVHSYSLMTNHFHLLLSSKVEGGMSRTMQLLGKYTVAFNQKHGQDGALFKGRFFSKWIDDERYLIEVVRYIANNAVKAGIVPLPDQYRWASHAVLLDHPTAPKVSLSPVLVDTYFNGRVHALDQFVNERNTDLAARYELIVDAELSEPSLVDALVYTAETAARVRNIHLESERAQACSESLVNHVCRSFELSLDEIAVAQHEHGRTARLTLMALHHRCQIATLATLAEAFGFSCKQSVCRVLKQFDRSAAEDSELSAILAHGEALTERAA